MKIIEIFFFVIFFNCLTMNICYSRSNSDSTKFVKITLNDGSVLKGNILFHDSLIVVIETTDNVVIDIPKIQVQNILLLPGNEGDNDSFGRDPNQSRLFFTPTAKPVSSEHGYFSIYEFVFPTISFGIEDIFSLSTGVSALIGVDNPLIYLAPKITLIQKNNLYISSGLFFITPFSGKKNSIEILYGLATYGDDLAAITFGGGWGFAKDRFSNTPVWMLGGELKIADGFKLITEHWIPTRTNEKLSSIGIRIYGHNFAADIGFVHPSDSDPVGFSNIPWLGFAYNF